MMQKRRRINSGDCYADRAEFQRGVSPESKATPVSPLSTAVKITALAPNNTAIAELITKRAGINPMTTKNATEIMAKKF